MHNQGKIKNTYMQKAVTYANKAKKNKSKRKNKKTKTTFPTQLVFVHGHLQ